MQCCVRERTRDRVRERQLGRGTDRRAQAPLVPPLVQGKLGKSPPLVCPPALLTKYLFAFEGGPSVSSDGVLPKCCVVPNSLVGTSVGRTRLRNPGPVASSARSWTYTRMQVMTCTFWEDTRRSRRDGGEHEFFFSFPATSTETCTNLLVVSWLVSLMDRHWI